MNTRYQPSTHSVRAVAAAAAVATVLALFDFVAGLGDAGAEAQAHVRAAQPAVTQVASVRSPTAQR